MDTIVWSATTCDFPGAGLYVGLAPDFEHLAVARGLGAKQARLFVGGRMRFNKGGRPWPFNYYAVRDPSSVRVVPVKRPPLPGGFRHAELRLHICRNGQRDAVVVRPPRNGHDPSQLFDPHLVAPAGFLVTIGLPLGLESRFFERMIDSHVDQDWSDVYARLVQEGCGEDPDAGEGAKRPKPHERASP
jgi:hypothetical protein